MTVEQIGRDLVNKKFYPIYFLMGDEPYYIDQISNYIAENVLAESEKAFNQITLYGKDVEMAAVINAAKRYPMMSKYQVVIIKEAQNIKNIDDLEYYAKNPLPSTILVINYKYKSLDKRKKVYKLLQEKGIVFESSRLYDDKMPAWIATQLKRKGYDIEPRGALMVAEFLGNDLTKVVNELEKLTITLKPGEKRITAEHIERNIGISKEYNVFELQKALVQNNAYKAYLILDYFGKNLKEHPALVTIANLFYFFAKVLLYHATKDKSQSNIVSVLKINPFFVKDYQAGAGRFSIEKTVQIISLLREYDLKVKGVGAGSSDHPGMMKELVYKILH